jgi:excisionase family DNA binding protein
MSVLPAPLVVIGERDAAWLAQVLEDLLRRGYFTSASTPLLGERAASLVQDCRAVATHGQRGACADAVDDAVLVTYQEAARLTSLSPRTLRRRVAEGSLPCVRVGSAVRLRRADLERLGDA